MKKVCVFCQKWESGGIESFIVNIISHMDLTELDIDVVVEQLIPGRGLEQLKRSGIHFIELSGDIRLFFENIRQFRNILRKQKYDILHMNIYQAVSLTYAKVAKEEGIPVRIAHSHNTALRKSASKPLKLLVHRLFSKIFTQYVTDLWACSGEAAEFMFSSSELKSRGYCFIPNGIDIDLFRFKAETRNAVRKELGLTNKFVIGNVGRLCYQKNQLFLLEAFSVVLRQRPDSMLLLIGEGPDYQMLVDRVEKLGITSRVMFLGNSQKVEQLLCAMDVFALPSQFEGLPLVSVEAQASGLPVICSENAIPPEASILPSLTRISLKAGCSAWADAIMNLTLFSREEASELVRKAGFYIKDTAQTVNMTYLR